MIEKIKLKFGVSISDSGLEINIMPITVFVGPNNSGKSKVLREIESYCRSKSSSSNDVIVGNIIFSSLSQKEIEEQILAIERIPNSNEKVSSGQIIIEKINSQTNQPRRIIVNKQALINEALNPQVVGVSNVYYKYFLDLNTLRLDGTNRLNLLNEQSAGDLQSTSINNLAYLFGNNLLREEVRRIVYEALGKYFVIDPTKIGFFRVRLSSKPPIDEREEKSWEEKSVEFHKAAVTITESSDGVKAFCGIITTLLAGDPKITLIDEPEAFLHPSLSNILGKEVGRSLNGTKKRLFIATHSSSFLMGCIQSGSPLNIVRLTYKNNIATARILSSDKILHLMRNPLLRSTGVLNGLFYESVVICEADADRAFYQEINERLLANADPRGINNCLYINAQNKQTVWDIVKPLRELGIPAVGIVDIDVIKDGGSVFSKPLEGAFIPTISHHSFHEQKTALLAAFNKTGKNLKRDGGIALLNKDEQEACNNFFNQFEEYGAFIVRNGELESWLGHLSVSKNKSTWLIEVFEKMGENLSDSNYMKPGTGDVWDFIGSIKKWFDNSSRKGIPN